MLANVSNCSQCLHERSITAMTTSRGHFGMWSQVYGEEWQCSTFHLITGFEDEALRSSAEAIARASSPFLLHAWTSSFKAYAARFGEFTELRTQRHDTTQCPDPQTSCGPWIMCIRASVNVESPYSWCAQMWSCIPPGWESLSLVPVTS